MSAATSTTKLTVMLPNEVIEMVREKVSSGEYADESAVVEAALVDLLLPPVSSSQISDDWLRREVVPVLERMNADSSRARTPEQVIDRLRDRHKSMKKAG